MAECSPAYSGLLFENPCDCSCAGQYGGSANQPYGFPNIFVGQSVASRVDVLEGFGVRKSGQFAGAPDYAASAETAIAVKDKGCSGGGHGLRLTSENLSLFGFVTEM